MLFNHYSLLRTTDDDGDRHVILGRAGKATTLLCARGKMQGGLQKLQEIASYAWAQAGKKITAETAGVVATYVQGIAVQVAEGADVCALGMKCLRGGLVA
jgi:hypothetical protein